MVEYGKLLSIPESFEIETRALNNRDKVPLLVPVAEINIIIRL
jgi:hypothetical protein